MYVQKWVHITTPHHNRFTALFPGPPGSASARRKLLDFMVQGKINRGRNTDHPTGWYSMRTNQYAPPHSTKNLNKFTDFFAVNVQNHSPSCSIHSCWSQSNFSSDTTIERFVSAVDSAVLSTFKHSHPASVHQLCCCAHNVYVAARRWIGGNFYYTVNTCTASLPCGLSCEPLHFQTD